MALALQERWQTWRRTRTRRRGVIAEPGTALFTGVRLRLTLWYIGVLAAVLLIAGTVLYLGVRQTLLHNVDQILAAAGHPYTEPRQGGQGGGQGGGPSGCPVRFPPPPGTRAMGIMCYAPDGTVV